jgi:hypothetical protein
MSYVERIYDAVTGETKEVTYTAEQQAEIELATKEAEAAAKKREAEAATAKAAKATLLERLGITEDEARLLLG